MAKEIQLTRGMTAIVDDEDYEYLSCYKWHCTSAGYAARNRKRDIRPRGIKMHREILNAPIGMEVDHINGNRLDNRRSNLRLVTDAQNSLNKRPRRNGTSKYKGVSFKTSEGKWRAQIAVNKRGVSLGAFRNEIDAAKAYDAAARQHHGEFASLNFPEVEHGE